MTLTTTRRMHTMPFGCQPIPDGGWEFALWAPAISETIQLVLTRSDEPSMRIPLQSCEAGWQRVQVPYAQVGDHYQFQLPNGQLVADPASRYQPQSVHGSSMVIDPRDFLWHDVNWKGRLWSEAVIYELHVGTFSKTGDFNGVIPHLATLVDLGVTAIELMPIADCPGQWNWGYDGVLLYAPAARYGTPHDLKSLIQAAHQLGLMVFLDVVYNHFGPEGNYLHQYAPHFFDPQRHTPWGGAIAFANQQQVRAFFIHNALYWLEEYHVDGLRLDAVEQISDPSMIDILDELADQVQSHLGHERHIHLMLENDLNSASRLQRQVDSQPRTFTAQWNDDFHHAIHVLLTGETVGPYQDFGQQPQRLLARALAEGYAYQGEPSLFRGGRCRGEASASLPPTAWIQFLQNHDQIGNRPHGERLYTIISDAAWETALAVLLLAPAPPLLFMGQEWGAEQPFLFFCDFEPELTRAITHARQHELATMWQVAHDQQTFPAMPTTVMACQLDWSERLCRRGQDYWLYHQQLLALRRAHIWPRLPAITHGGCYHLSGEGGLEVLWTVQQEGILGLRVNLSDQSCSLITSQAHRHRQLIYTRNHHDWDVMEPWSLCVWFDPFA
jgi:malto-oligosyltrehalose trehalohydrolase